MQKSLARRERRRRSENGSGNHRNGGSPARRLAIALPLFLLAAFVALGGLGFIVAVGAYASFSSGLPDPKQLLENLDFSQESVVQDRTGATELARFSVEKRTVLTYDQIPPIVIDATTSIEDKTFWENAGFDPFGIASAAIDTIRGNGRGASTITQQIVRARLLPESAFSGSTYQRKIKEIIQSIRLTQEYAGSDGKQAIMAAYLNQNFYGNQSYGIAAAARTYFGVTDLSKLTLAQAAILAGIPQSPSTYDLVKNAVETEVTSADGKTKTTELVVPADSAIVQRRNYILDLMKTRSVLTNGKYSDANYEAAKKEAVVLAPQSQTGWKAPQFVYQVRHELGSILCGADSADNCPEIDTGGYTIQTTLDWNMQQIAEKWVKAAAIVPNSKTPAATAAAIGVPYQAWMKNLVGKGVYNAALGSLDYRTGQVLSLVGSADYYSKNASKKFQPQFDVFSDGWRQSGSAFKPINYLAGIENKSITAATLLMDVATDFGGGWVPLDADTQERGPLRVREAIQMSLNIPAIKAAVRIGPDKVFEFAKKAGIVFQNNSKNVAGGSIAIGTLEVHYSDLLSAYGAIANNGSLMPRTTIMKVTDPTGKVVYEYGEATGTQVASPAAAYVMTSIIASNTDPKQNPWWATRAIYDGKTRRPATLKTGTTNDTIDLAAFGYLAPPADANSPALAVGAWMGNSDNSAPPNGVVSLETAASLWQAYLTEVSKGTPIADFKAPAGVTKATIDAHSGMLPGQYTTATTSEYFVEGTQPTQADTTKVGIEVDDTSNLLWQDGCLGPKVTKGFLDLSKVEAQYPTWQKYDDGWIARAAQGVGVRGGPKNTRTAYFTFGGFAPFGASWGAPIVPTTQCTISLESPSPSPGDSGWVPPGQRTPTPAPTFPTPKPTITPKPTPRRRRNRRDVELQPNRITA